MPLLLRPSRVQIFPAASFYRSYAVFVKKYILDIRSNRYKQKSVHLYHRNDVLQFCRYVFSRVVTNFVYKTAKLYFSSCMADRIAVETVPVACVQVAALFSDFGSTVSVLKQLPCRTDRVTDIKLLRTKCLLWPKKNFLARVQKFFFLLVFMLRVQYTVP